jgi:hypothetical protein
MIYRALPAALGVKALLKMFFECPRAFLHALDLKIVLFCTHWIQKSCFSACIAFKNTVLIKMQKEPVSLC